MKTAYCVKQLRQDQRNHPIIALSCVRSNSFLKGVNHMTICPIALAVGCKKCPAFKFCPLTTILGDQEEKDEWDRVWEENFPTADEHLDKIEDKYQKYAEEELEKNKPLTKDERLALIKKSAEKELAHYNESW